LRFRPLKASELFFGRWHGLKYLTPKIDTGGCRTRVRARVTDQTLRWHDDVTSFVYEMWSYKEDSKMLICFET